MSKLLSFLRHFWGKSIRRRLVLGFASVTTLLMLGVGYVVVVNEETFLRLRSAEHATELARTLAVGSSSWVLANDVVGLQEVIHSVSTIPSLEYALVIAPDGRVLASNHPDRIGKYLDDDISRRLLKSEVRIHKLIDDGQMVDVAVPVELAGRHLAWARIGMRLDAEQDNLQHLIWHGYFNTLLGMLAAIIVSWLISRSLTRGLRELMGVAAQVEQGNREVRADATRLDEVGVLAGDFNRMLDALVDSEYKLARLNRIYAAWTECTDAIVREKDNAVLFPSICRILVERVPFQLVWIGMARGDQIEKVAASDRESGYLRNLHLTLDAAQPEGNGPVSLAIRTGQQIIFNDFLHDPRIQPWHEIARQHGLHAVAAFPLRQFGRCVGALAVYAGEAGYFNDENTTLLHGLADDLSFALDSFEIERQHKAATAQLALVAKVFESSHEAIVITHADFHIVSTNQAFTTITGYLEGEVRGHTPVSLLMPGHAEALSHLLRAEIESHGYWQGEVQGRRRDGTEYPAWLTVTCVSGEAGERLNYIGIFSDISERKLTEQRIQHLAHFDVLTDLPNRLLLRDRLEQAMLHAERSQEKLAVLFLDIDHFKAINDTLGHSAGDRLLQLVAQRLQEQVRKQDTVCRQGGDEFILVLLGVDAEGAAQVAQKILRAVSASYLVEAHELRITLSIGISLYPDHTSNIDELIKFADTAMYSAKENGRNNYQLYAGGAVGLAVERLALENDLHAALEQDQFELYYQPQVDLADGRIIGCEALIRWHHPTQGLIHPASFISLAEESGLIVAIGEVVLAKACQQSRLWQEAGLPLTRMAVNLSSLQFRQRDLTTKLARLMEENRLNPCQLEMELTESILMQEVDSVLATLREMDKMGLQLSIDDFGTGYSSFAYLKRFPLSKLKIDQSFVHDLVADGNDAAIVRAIILMAHSLNLRVIAEGVESAEQADFLLKEGCDEAQGYYFSRPVPAVEFAELLRAGRTLADYSGMISRST
ncbi:MAG: EAL domain-containing protein [Nitrosomonadales bacterium]|nr:EAL domain-containing protein [Nitrosomonadales bacterium]